MAWNGFKRVFVYLKTAFFEPFLGVESGYKPMDTGASSYFFDSKITQLSCPTMPTKLPFGRLPSHISRKANRATGGLGPHHQRANGFNHLR